jgi:hypothetical protein
MDVSPPKEKCTHCGNEFFGDEKKCTYCRHPRMSESEETPVGEEMPESGRDVPGPRLSRREIEALSRRRNTGTHEIPNP